MLNQILNKISFDSKDNQIINLQCGANTRNTNRTKTLYNSYNDNENYELIYIKGCKFSVYSFLAFKHEKAFNILISIMIPQVVYFFKKIF
jgi:hypothetical protein